jgi:TctA family transporter
MRRQVQGGQQTSSNSIRFHRSSSKKQNKVPAKKLKYPLAPLVLGDMAETSFRQSMLLSGGSVAIFWSNGLVGTIVTLALVILSWPRCFGSRRRGFPVTPAEPRA